jgi:glycosyltransferase involved in cell wall biosynthesis
MIKKRILIDARCVGGEGQGMLTYLKGLYNALHENYAKEYELFFAGYHEEAMKKAFPFMKPARFIQLPQANKFQLLGIIFPSIEKEYKIDFAHFQYVTPFFKNSKHIVTTHDLLFLDFPEEFSKIYKLKRKHLFKRSLEKSDIRLTVSNYSKNRISDSFQIPQNTISITPNAVHNKFFQDYDKKAIQEQVKGKFGLDNYLLYVSRIEKRKNQQLLLEAYETLELAEKDIQLVFVGNDTLGETSTATQIQELKSKYPGKIHWLSHLTDDDLLNVYRAARIFLYPSLAEGFGIPPIEAAALGIETLCSNRTAMQDFSFFGEQLFDPAEKDDFYAKLSKLIKETPKERVNLENRQHIQSKYSWNHAAEVLHHEIASLNTSYNYQVKVAI